MDYGHDEYAYLEIKGGVKRNYWYCDVCHEWAEQLNCWQSEGKRYYTALCHKHDMKFSNLENREAYYKEPNLEKRKEMFKRIE